MLPAVSSYLRFAKSSGASRTRLTFGLLPCLQIVEMMAMYGAVPAHCIDPVPGGQREEPNKAKLKDANCVTLPHHRGAPSRSC